MRLFVPDVSGDLDIAPLPPRLPPEVSVAGRLVLVSLRAQAFGAYEDGALVRWGPTSTGRRSSPTPAGAYHANWRARLHRSTIDPDWLLPWYVNIHNRSGISFHAYALPGYPASHACIRLLEPDAEWLYEWVETWTLDASGQVIRANGTPVVVFGAYDYSAPPPWSRLDTDPGAATVTPEELAEAVRPYSRVTGEGTP
jgi:hypothetical protein